MKTQSLGRRAVLQGIANATLALPIAQFSLAGNRLFAQGASPPVRLLTLFFPGGVKQSHWSFAGALQGLQSAQLANTTTVIHNLDFPAARFYSGAMNPHAYGVGALFSGVSLSTDIPTARRQAGGSSVEWIAANKLNPNVPVKGVSLSLESPLFTPDTMMGVHEKVTSWIDSRTPCQPITDPLKTFNLFFAGAQQDQDIRRQQLTRRRSILDNLIEQYRKFGTSGVSPLGTSGSALLRQHFEELRALEVRATNSLKHLNQTCGKDVQAPPAFPKYGYDQYLAVFALQRDLLMAALKCDLVRFANLAFSGAVANLLLPGYTEDNHHSAHFSSAGSTSESNYNSYVTRFVKEFSILLRQMHDVVESNGQTMLENSCSLLATEMGDGAAHDFSNLSMAVIGGRGVFPGGIVNGNRRPINDVLLSALRFVGVKDVNSLGDPAHNNGPLFG